MPLSPELQQAVDDFAAQERVLVASDFDGTLAPLVLDPSTSRAVEGGMESLADLSALPGVWVALVSGRDLGTLRELSGAVDPLVLLGSHGSEDSRRADGAPLSAEQQVTLTALDEELEALRVAHPGIRVEVKPSARVVHTRGLEEAAAEAALAGALGVAERHAVTVTPGKQVVELSVGHVGKGPAMVGLADDLGADAILYVGDDVTDEQGFEALTSDPDRERAARRLTIRVGEGETSAQHRVADEAAVVEVFRALHAARR